MFEVSTSQAAGIHYSIDYMQNLLNGDYNNIIDTTRTLDVEMNGRAIGFLASLQPLIANLLSYLGDDARAMFGEELAWCRVSAEDAVITGEMG